MPEAAGVTPERGTMTTGAIAWGVIFFAVLLWSGFRPHDYPTWGLEVAPAIVAAVVLLATRRRFPLTTLLYVLILVHCVILIVGGHYTYAEVPLGEWVRDTFGQSRNNYDKLGHFVQGFVPVIVARELSLRLGIFKSRAWMNLFIVGLCLGISALYELFEWWVALLSGEAAESFLGTQGFAWDTQSDMFLALVGAIVALLALRHMHDRQLAALATARGHVQAA